MVVPFTHIQEEIRDKCHEELFTLIMRRFMMRIAERVAVEYGCGALSSPVKVARSGCQPDHARHGRYRRGVRAAGIPSLHRHG